MSEQERFKLNFLLREKKEETIEFMNSKIAELKRLFQSKYGESRELDDRTAEMHFFDALDYYRSVLKDYDQDLELSHLSNEEYMTTVYAHLDVVTKAKYVKEDDFSRLLQRFLSTWQERFGGIVRNKKGTKWLVIRPNLANANVSDEVKNANPKWTFPKGKRDFFAETDKECARREILEETGLDLDLKKFGNSITLDVNGTSVKLFVILNVLEDYLIQRTAEGVVSIKSPNRVARKRKIVSSDDEVDSSMGDDSVSIDESFSTKRKLQLPKRVKVDGWTNVLNDLGLDEKVIRHDLDTLPRRLSIDLIDPPRRRFSVNFTNSNKNLKRFSCTFPDSDLTANDKKPQTSPELPSESPGPSSSNNKPMAISSRKSIKTALSGSNDEYKGQNPTGKCSLVDFTASEEVSEIRWMDIRAFYDTNYVKLVNSEMEESYGHARLCSSTHKLLTLALESRVITHQVGQELKRGRTIYIRELKEALANEKMGFFRK